MPNTLQIDPNKPVQVYRNLNKPGCFFSVRQNGRVRGYVESIVLKDARYKHATAKQLEQVRTGARQVCQWITGTIVGIPNSGSADLVSLGNDMHRVSCDPKKSDGFTIDGNQVTSSTYVSLSSNGCFATR